jgi:O-antigen ligase
MRASSRGDLVVGVVVCVAVLGLAAAAPGDAGVLLAGVAVAALVALVALSDPVLALVMLVLASFVRLAQKEIISTEFMTPALIALVLSLVYAVARRVKEWPQLGAIEWLMGAYLVCNLLSWALPHEYEAFDPISGASSDVYRWILTGVVLPFAGYIAAKTVLDDERSVKWLLWAIVAMAGYSSWVSIMQFHGPRALVWPKYIVDAPNWDGRANGVFNQPVVNGVILVVGFMVCLFLASRPGVGRRTRWALYGLAVANAYSVYLTHTRATLLSLIVVIAMGIVFARGWRRGFVVFATLGVVAVAANASAFFSSDRSAGGIGSSHEIEDRLNILATAFRAISEHPFLGMGIARFQAYNTLHHMQWSQNVPWNAGYGIISHENEIGIAAELGIPGALLWTGVMVGIVYLLWRALRELPQDSFLGAPLALVGSSAMVIMILNGLFVDLRILDFAMLLPFVLAGMVVGQLERHRAPFSGVRPGLPGSGLPGGMSADEQRTWQDEHRAEDAPDDPRLEPAR